MGKIINKDNGNCFHDPILFIYYVKIWLADKLFQIDIAIKISLLHSLNKLASCLYDDGELF